MTTEIILQLKQPEDISLLIAFVEKSGIAFRQRLRKAGTATRKPPVSSKQMRPKATLGQHIGSMLAAFEQHLLQTRSEWDGLTLLSRNESDFVGIPGLAFINPFISIDR